ncbi:MAG: hypothetical protein EOM03_05680, partial [Clostridia bacterium]|nr:hypothetical protein [Clostridia bacterium]
MRTQKLRKHWRILLMSFLIIGLFMRTTGAALAATMPVTTFTQMPDYSTVVSQPASDAILEDMNGDSLPDLVFTTVGDSSPSVTLPSLNVAFGNGDGTFGSAMTVATVSDQPYFIVNNMHALNINGDAYRDLVLVLNNGTFCYFLGSGAGGFLPKQTLSFGDANFLPYGLAVADFDHDGFDDFVSANENADQIKIFFGGATTPFSRETSLFSLTTNVNEIQIGDFNGDSWMDFAVSSENNATFSVHMNVSGVSFNHIEIPAIVTDTPFTVKTIDTGFFDADSYCDLLVGSDNGIYFLQSQGDGTFATPVAIGFGDWNSSEDGDTVYTADVAAADFNGDGNLDAMALTRVDSALYFNYSDLFIRYGLGDGTFGALSAYNFFTPGIEIYSSSLSVADLNLDGKMDIGIDPKPFAYFERVLLNTTSVLPPNDPPVISGFLQTVAFLEDSPGLMIYLDNFVSDLNSLDNELVWSCSGNTNVTVQITDRIAAISGFDNWFGTERLTFRVVDPGGLFDEALLDVTVIPVNDPPWVQGIPDQTIAEGESFAPVTLDLYVTDIEDTPSQISWSSSGNTALTVSIIERVATITAPHADWNGAETITFFATDSDGTQAFDSAVYTITPVAEAPTVTSISPVSGTTAGGTAVTISGTEFAEGASVTIGGAAATGVVVTNATTITATTPAHAAGMVDVVVTNPDEQSGTLSNSFTYVAPPPAPTVAGISPATGLTAGGTAVTITGTGFVEEATVAIGDAAATGVVVTNATTITAFTPAHAAGLVDVVVTNPGEQPGTLSNGFTYVTPPAPTVSGISPTSGTSASNAYEVVISGDHFIQGAAVELSYGTASIGGSEVWVTSAQEIECTFDLTAVTDGFGREWNVKVTNPDQQSAQATLFTMYRPNPTITSITPNAGITGETYNVTIRGTNFVANETVIQLSLLQSLYRDAANVQVISPTELTATFILTDMATGAWNVALGVFGAEDFFVLQNGFLVTPPPPIITAVDPNSGPTAGGTEVTITGSGFHSVTTVTFDGLPAASVSYLSETSLRATTPAHAAGVVDVAVTNPDEQSGTLSNGFTYVAPPPAPTVAGISPATGTTAGGTAVTITGIGFVEGATVTIGGTTATGVVVSNATTITAITPAHAAGVVDVVVTNPDEQSDTLSNGFTYVSPPPAPTVAGISPASGSTAGGTSITITGTGFVE